ncbi:MAG: response regulator [Candidatus Sungbacteria bacterium]|nr:response regulator [bacterium]MDZ4285603.1 response regulator [Candidatus Sungbacteria bacterium]
MKTIVLIEDDPIILKVLSDVLTDAGYTIWKAVDGDEGVEMVKSKKPDLILLNIMLPKKDGIEVLREIKGDPMLRHIPVFMLTALEDPKRLADSIALGAESYMVKSEEAINDVVRKVKEKLG